MIVVFGMALVGFGVVLAIHEGRLRDALPFLCGGLALVLAGLFLPGG